MRQKSVSIGDDLKKALITPLRERFDVKVEDGPDLDVQGNIVDHEYRITDGDRRVAEVSKKWFRVADTYGVEVAEGEDPVLILAITAVVDNILIHATRQNSSWLRRDTTTALA